VPEMKAVHLACKDNVQTSPRSSVPIHNASIHKDADLPNQRSNVVVNRGSDMTTTCPVSNHKICANNIGSGAANSYLIYNKSSGSMMFSFLMAKQKINWL